MCRHAITKQFSAPCGPGCDEGEESAAGHAAQGHSPAGPADPSCAQVLPLGHQHGQQHRSALQQEAGMENIH